ncbi:MAG TPA: hypothetical protein VEI73_03135 [Candidatus Acidoferrum sp.]|nr:hypothetical protein [Candidatus Acidoferrum sp.]
MRLKAKLSSVVLLAAGLAAILIFTAANAAAAGPENVTLTVTAVGKKDVNAPPVSRGDVQFYVNKERTQIADWRRGEKLYLVVLIDDSLNSQVASQWNDLKEFFNNQPDTTYISVSYARNGEAMLVQDFTNDHALAAKALRLPMGSGAFSSPYFAVQDLIKRWPSSGDRRSILLISSGIDYFHGNYPTSPDLETTIEHAQKQNINIWSIYYPDAGQRSHRFFLVGRAQSDLSELTEETGGESFYMGTTAPVAFKPFLDELATHLNNQYLLAFQGNGGAKGRFERDRVTTEVPNLEFLHASQVFLPAQ